MSRHYGSAVWKGKLTDGEGKMKLGSLDLEADYTFCTRFEDCEGTSPEEFIGAAHSGCFSMYLSHLLNEKGYQPEEINTSAEVEIKEKEDGGIIITQINLDTKVRADIEEEAEFEKIANNAKENCPVSLALAGVENVTLTAELI